MKAMQLRLERSSDSLGFLYQTAHITRYVSVRDFPLSDLRMVSFLVEVLPFPQSIRGVYYADLTGSH